MLRRHLHTLNLGDGTAPIAVGLVALIASAFVPQIPVVSAMALVATGATSALCSRIERAYCTAVVLAAHLCVYLSLYFIFVGAAVHSATSDSHHGIHVFLIADLCVSLLIIALGVRRAIVAIMLAGAR